MKNKITIIGAGNVGATCAELIAQRELSDVVLLDVDEGIAKGKALDIQQACTLWSSSSHVHGTSSYEDTEGSNVVVITAGLARKPGMSRDDLRDANSRIVSSVAEKIREFCSRAIVIVVTNPMDVMAYLTYRVTGFPKERIIGMGGILDAARFATFIAQEIGVSYADVKGLVLGGHGDLMVPLPNYTTVYGVPITSLLSIDTIDKLIERTRSGGAEIVSFLKSGSAYYAPAASILEIVEAVIKDKKRLLPCSVYLDGEYGIYDTFTGVPIMVSSKGCEKIIELPLGDKDLEALRRSASAVSEQIKKLVF
ncbi:MAG: malate dehydrogenase [Nitrospirae bacterium]|nr:MAG: malate dehydrogenase [Nitrospirota bacterium]